MRDKKVENINGLKTLKRVRQKLHTLKQVGLRGAYHRLMYAWQGRERRCSFGDKNADITFYVIRGIDYMSKHYTGVVALHLLAVHSYVLSHILYAREKGWTPVVDQEGDPTVSNREEFAVNGTYNPWEYFWRQPSPYTLEDVYVSRHVVLSRQNWYEPGNLGYSIENHQNLETIHFYHELSSCAPLNDETAKQVNHWRESLFTGRGKILGISLRRGGHAKGDDIHGPNHPIQPEPEEMIEIARQRMQEWKMDCIFLATEEELYIEQFQKIFGTKLIFLPRIRYHDWHSFAQGKDPLYQPGHRYQTTLEYLTEMELLACCNALIGSITSGLRYAIIQNDGGYEHLEVLDCGRFPKKE